MTTEYKAPTPEELGNVQDPEQTLEQENLDPDFLKSLVAPEVDPKVVEEQEHDKKGYIPKGRFNEKNEEAKALAIENATLKTALEKLAGPKEEPLPQIDPLDELEEGVVNLAILATAAERDYGLESQEYRDAVKAHAKANRQLNQMEAKRQAESVESKIDTKTAQATQTKNELLEVAAAAYEVYPFMDVNAEDANQEAIDKVVQLRDAYTATGIYTPAKALQAAIDLIAPNYLASYKSSVDPKVADIAAARAKAEREKAAKANAQQPGFVKGRSEENEFKVDISKLTDAEFAALPKDVLDRLKGNVVEG